MVGLMRYRSLDVNGDYSFGKGPLEILVNSPECVAQACKTRLALFVGEWYLDQENGTPYSTDILGENTRPLYDQAIQERILETQGVDSITAYASVLNGAVRALSITATISTIYGTTDLVVFI